MLLNVAHPIPDVVEGSLVRHIIHQQDAHGSSVVGCAKEDHRLQAGLSWRISCPAPWKLSRYRARRHRTANQQGSCCQFMVLSRCVPTASDCSEALLSCCVPYLKLDPLVVNKYFLDFEVNSALIKVLQQSCPSIISQQSTDLRSWKPERNSVGDIEKLTQWWL